MHILFKSHANSTRIFFLWDNTHELVFSCGAFIIQLIFEGQFGHLDAEGESSMKAQGYDRDIINKSTAQVVQLRI